MKRILVVVALAAAIGAILMVKQREQNSAPTNTPIVESPRPSPAESRADTPPTQPAPLPKLLELGSEKCIPCRMMAPILDELRTTHAGKLEIVFYDVWKDPRPAQQYAIRVIPTQIFLAPDGRELFRHEGFFPKDELLKKWRELGYDF